MKKNIKTQSKVYNTKDGWVCTDPDTKQYGRQLGPKKFEFVQHDIEQTEINLNEYTEDKIEDAINSFGYTLRGKKGELNIYDEFGKEANWIMAECLFELEM